VAERVLAPPYDVLSEAEAREIASGNPHCFLHVTRPEVGFPDGVDSHSEPVYAMGRTQLLRLMEEGVLVQEESPVFYLYSQKMGEHRQAGLMAVCSVREYDEGLIKKHEFTRPDKEQDRVDHILGSRAQTGLVMLTHRASEQIEALQARALAVEPLYRVRSADGVEHTLTRIGDPVETEAWRAAFSDLGALYIADGHHRSAAASRVAARLGEGPQDWFLAGIFPENQLQVLAYNRVVDSLGSRTPADFLSAVEAAFSVEANVEPMPTQRGDIHMYLQGSWHRLRLRDGLLDESDPVACMDAAVLQDHLLAPLLEVRDPRRDTHIRFVGGIRGHEALSGPVDRGEAAVAFCLFPTGIDQMISVADAGRVMPPKSTWFEPKLAGGVVVHSLEG
jgi:uncharacterized protein (DUF1015 family)